MLLTSCCWCGNRGSHLRLDCLLWCWSTSESKLNQKCFYNDIGDGILLEQVSHSHRPWKMRRANSLEKTLMLGKIEGRRRWDDGGWDGWTASPTQWTLVWASSGSWWWKGKTAVLQPMESWRVRHDWATKRMNNNTYFQVHLGLFIGKIVSEI